MTDLERITAEPHDEIQYTTNPATKLRMLRWGEHQLAADGAVDYREGLITLRDSALENGNTEWAVYLSHMIIGWGMMSKWVFGAEYERALSLAEVSKKSQAEAEGSKT